MKLSWVFLYRSGLQAPEWQGQGWFLTFTAKWLKMAEKNKKYRGLEAMEMPLVFPLQKQVNGY